MADRPAGPQRQAAPGIPRSRAGGVVGGGGGGGGNGGASTASVRRNLFQSQLTRRPTPASSTSGETLRLDGDSQAESSSEIVVRDKNGDVELGDPPTPPTDDPDEVALDARQENEKERQRLADAVKHHQINQNSVPTQPEELLEAVRASLRAKVAALSEDNWMYEAEEVPRYQ